MNRIASKISGGYEPIGADLSLDAEVPLINVHVRRVIVHSGHRRISRPSRVVRPKPSSVGQRKWISSGFIRPRILEIHIVSDESGKERRSIAEALQEQIRRKVIERSRGGANRRAAVAIHVPCKSHPRRKIQPFGVDAAIGGKSGITRKEYARRYAGKPAGLDAFSHRIEVEMCDRVIGVDHGEVRFPAQTIIQGQFGIQLPGVGSIQPKIPGPLILVSCGPH